MEKVILTISQVMELKNKLYKLESEIEEIKYLLLIGEKTAIADNNNFGDNTNYSVQSKLVSLIHEKAEIEILLENFEYANPKGTEIGYGSMIQYMILNSSDPELIGKTPRIMLVQKNYSDARPEGYRYVSKNSSIGQAFYGARLGNEVMFNAGNGNEFTAVVLDVDNNLCMNKPIQK